MALRGTIRSFLSNRKQAYLIVFVIGNSVLLYVFCLYQTKEITPISPLEMMRLKKGDTFNAWYVILYNVYVLESVHFSFPTWPMGQAMQLGDLGLDFGATLELFPGWAVLNSPSFNGELSQLMKRLQDCPCPGSKLATLENIESLLILDNLTFHSSTLVQANCCYAWIALLHPFLTTRKV